MKPVFTKNIFGAIGTFLMMPMILKILQLIFFTVMLVVYSPLILFISLIAGILLFLGYKDVSLSRPVQILIWPIRSFYNKFFK